MSRHSYETQEQKLRHRLGELADEGQAILAKVRNEKREMTDEENRRSDEIHREFSKIETQLSEARLEHVQAVATAPEPRITISSELIHARVQNGAVRLGAPNFASPVGAPLGSDASVVKAIASFTRTGVRSFQNAMSIGSDADGGYEVPIQLDRDLQTVAANYSPLLKLAKVVEGVTDGYRANVATTLPASAWKAEGDARGVTNSPTLAQIVPQRGAVAAVVQASQWVMQDADHDLYSFLVSELGRQFGAAIGAAIISGANAAASPKGITAQTTAATADGVRAFGTLEHLATGGANTAPTLDHCISLLSKMHPFYLNDPSCAWLMSPSAAAALMTEKAAGGGSYQWQPDLSASQPPTLFGKPVHIDPGLPAATTGNALSVWLGAWQRAYVVVRYGRPILIRDDVTVKGQVLLYSEQRVGGNMVDSSALKAIKTAV